MHNREQRRGPDRRIQIRRDEDGRLVDITNPRSVEVEIAQDGGRLWVNVDGVCVLRICQIPRIHVKGPYRATNPGLEREREAL